MYYYRSILILNLFFCMQIHAAQELSLQSPKKYPELPLRVREGILDKRYELLSKFLDEKPENVEAVSFAGVPLIIYAAQDPKALELVLAKKPDLNRIYNQRTPLLTAVEYEQEESVRLLVLSKAAISSRLPFTIMQVIYPMNALELAEYKLRRQCATPNQVAYIPIAEWPRENPIAGKEETHATFGRILGYLQNPASAGKEEKKTEGKKE